MGQNYDTNGTYIKWSPYFDYTSLATLEASKKLTVPKGIKVNHTNDGVDLTNEIDTLVSISKIDNTSNRLTARDMSKKDKLTFIKTLAVALRKIESSKGNYSYQGNLDNNILSNVLQTFIDHEEYTAPESVAESAYKNVASANIYSVSHDIRNRDQAYTAITVNTMNEAAENSPKGEQTAHLNMLNPLTKYIMQYQNLVGKDVIGISANGEKFWFNAYYYWTHILKTGTEEDLKYLQFKTTLNRVQNRSTALKENNINLVTQHTTTHLPDLNTLDKQIRDRLVNSFEATEDSMEYKYVDGLISELLSSATDNAKMLILAKINAGTNFAKMYIHLMTMGYSVNDIVSFMVCPIAEFIDSKATKNMFQSLDENNSAFTAINLAQGIVQSRDFLHGNISEYNPEKEDYYTVNKSTLVKNILMNKLNENENLKRTVFSVLNINIEKEGTIKLDTLMQGIILTTVGDLSTFNINTLIGQIDDIEINTYLQYCSDLVSQLKMVNAKYGNNMNELLADAKEFKKIYNLASEISTISSSYLGLNQGLPTDKLSLLKRLNSMRRVVTDRESVLGIDEEELFPNNETNNDVQSEAWVKIIDNILENNSLLTRDEIISALNKAHEADIMNHFSVYKMLTDDTYKQIAKEYLHIIKGTVNVIDMMGKIPHYKEILECFKSLIISEKYLSSKSRLILELTSNENNLSDKQLQGIVRYADKLNILNFLNQCDIVSTHKSVDGFNAYFDTIKTNQFDLSTVEGVAGFKRFMETEFVSYLKDNHSDNPLVKHLTTIISNGRPALSVDIDLLNPKVTAVTQLAYDDVIKGMALFEQKSYTGNYTIADLFQLYNLIVNNNQYGGERLTTAFKACSRENSVLQSYLSFTADNDYTFDYTPEINQIDYQINAAPIIYPAAEKYHTEPFIKVQDPVWGYIIKRYNKVGNFYTDYNIFPAIFDNSIDENKQNTRRENFIENYPFEMPQKTKADTLARALNFEEEITPEMSKQIYDILANLSLSGKILIVKDC